jgi:hypothetical protein
VVLLGALFAAGFVALGQDEKPLWEIVSTPEQPPSSKEVIAAQVVRVDVARLRSSDANARFSLVMPDKEKLLIVKSRQVQMQSAVVWIGTIAGDPRSAVTLSAGKSSVVGTIASSRGPLYRLRLWKRDLHVVERVDPTKFPDESTPRSNAGQPRAHAAGSNTGSGACTDSGEQIDVMVAYTDDARVQAPGTEQMQLKVYEAIQQTNESYIKSGIAPRLRLVHLVEVDYQETGNIDTDLDALLNNNNLALGGLHALRDLHRADVVVLITETSSDRGKSTIMETVSHDFEDRAFAVVRRDTATTLFTFAHELGHIMSARHDTLDDQTPGERPYAYNHAHAQPHPTTASVAPWRTIMATNKPCDKERTPAPENKPVYCTRLLQWSNPVVDWYGDATGVENLEDNARTLNNTACTVANFRCSSQSQPNPPTGIDVN